MPPKASEKVCNACGKTGELSTCAGCQRTYYCSKEHQKQDWKAHKAMCKLLQEDKNALDFEGKKGEYIGTLRWGPETKFMELPAFPEERPHLENWETVMTSRLPARDDGKVVVEPTFLDGLSYPVTLVYALQKLPVLMKLLPEGKRAKVYVIGAAEKTEERLFKQSKYWEEIGHYFPKIDIDLVLVGPEISHGQDKVKKEVLKNMTIECRRNTLSGLWKEEKPDDTCSLIIGYNTGFGCGGFELMWSWIYDLIAIAKSNIPAIFTCANDYSDLRGETKIMQEVIGAGYLLAPMENPFRAVTYVHEPGKRDTAWACSSSYIYCIKGFAQERTKPLYDERPAILKKRLKELSKTLVK